MLCPLSCVNNQNRIAAVDQYQMLFMRMDCRLLFGFQTVNSFIFHISLPYPFSHNRIDFFFCGVHCSFRESHDDFSRTISFQIYTNTIFVIILFDMIIKILIWRNVDDISALSIASLFMISLTLLFKSLSLRSFRWKWLHFDVTHKAQQTSQNLHFLLALKKLGANGRMEC